MEVHQLHWSNRMYWEKEGCELLHALNYGKIISRSRSEDLMKQIQLFFNRDDDQQILDIVQAVIRQFQDSLGPGSYMILDESMIK